MLVVEFGPVFNGARVKETLIILSFRSGYPSKAFAACYVEQENNVRQCQLKRGADFSFLRSISQGGSNPFGD